MRPYRTLKLAVVAALLALGLLLGIELAPPALQAQGYSGALPNVTATAATGLGLTYTAGTVAQGGATQAITAGTLSATDSKTSCVAPAYSGCNIVYWASGTGLSITTTPATAFAVGNVPIAFVTATGGNISAVTPAAWSPATAAYNTLRPSGSDTGGSYWVPPTACNSSVSGNGTGTQGFTILGTAPSIPVVQAQTSNIGTNTHYYTCNITPPSNIGVTGRGANIVSASFFYGVQTTGLGTQATVAASGTMNGKLVFTKIAYPTAAAGQTPTGLAEAARADSGTLGFSDLTNVATTTAGEFYTLTFTPATPIAATAALTQYFLTVSLLNTAISATITNSPGVLVSYTY